MKSENDFYDLERNKEELLDEIAEKATISDISPELVYRKTKLGRIITDSFDEEKVKKGRVYEVEFKERVFCQCVVIDFSSPPDDVEVNVLSSFAAHAGVSSSEDNFFISINNVIDGFSLSFKASRLKKVSIRAVRVYGFNAAALSDIHDEFEVYYERVELFKSQAESLMRKLAKERELLLGQVKEYEEIEQKLSALEVEYPERKKELDEILSEHNNMVFELSRIEDEKRKIQKDISEHNDEIKQKNVRIDELRSHEASLRKEVKILENDKHVWSDDIRTFNKESSLYISLYSWLTFLCLAIIASASVYLMGNAKAFMAEPYHDLVGVVVSRIPFSAVMVSVILAAYFTSKAFILKIMELHRKRLSLATIGMIAREVSESSALGLKLSDEEEYERRKLLKMELLKVHLAEELGKEFDMAGRRKDALDKAVGISRLFGGGGKNKNDVKDDK